MKKIFAIVIAIAAISFAASAQPKAIGIRAGLGGELSYQHWDGPNFLEFDLGAFGHSACLTGMYDFVLVGGDAFRFYAGPGVQAGSWYGDDYTGLDIAVAGQAGFEYNFNIPLMISIDWRPSLHLLGAGKGFYGSGFALAFRYQF